MAVQNIKAIGGGLELAAPATGQKSQGFGDVFRQAVSAVNSTMQEAADSANGLVAGEHANIHETMIAMETASIEFRMLTKAQNKVVDAYREIMRLQL
ncbi:MAG: flagellar hook-basal body complex protein FliE [Thermodesulfobacteriota bacterium]